MLCLSQIILVKFERNKYSEMSFLLLLTSIQFNHTILHKTIAVIDIHIPSMYGAGLHHTIILWCWAVPYYLSSASAGTIYVHISHISQPLACFSNLVACNMQLIDHSLKILPSIAARSSQPLACSSWLVAISIAKNIRSPSFVGFCQFDTKIKFNCFLDVETGFMLFS